MTERWLRSIFPFLQVRAISVGLIAHLATLLRISRLRGYPN